MKTWYYLYLGIFLALILIFVRVRDSKAEAGSIKSTNKYSWWEFICGIALITALIVIGIQWQIDPAVSRFEKRLGIAAIIMGTGISIVLVKRLSEMCLLGYFRSLRYTEDGKLNNFQSAILKAARFIYRITHPRFLEVRFRRLRAKKMFQKRSKFSGERWLDYYKVKQKAIEKILGPMDNMVGHAIIPFDAGGALDMYYFSSYMPGTVFCSMELIDPDGDGPIPSSIGTYEVMTCTKEKHISETGETFEERKKRIEDGRITPFERINSRMCGIMTMLGRYSFENTLQPGETCELPGKDEMICVVLDRFDSDKVQLEIEERAHGLLLCMEVFRSEMEYARKNGSENLLAKLKDAKAYPYSDLDREPVV